MSRERILVIAHGHPDFDLGGGEIAAYNLFKAYRDCASVEDAWFIGRIDRGTGASGRLNRRRPAEYLWEMGLKDSFRMKAANPFAIWHDFEQILQTLKPTHVHVHHYFHIGIELLRWVKCRHPHIRLMLTLHEYLAICHQRGQMVKQGSYGLCWSASYEDCHRCFPEFSVEQFWLRKQFLQRHFDAVDLFVAPSAFLRQRYLDWGLPADRIHVVENGQEASDPLPPRHLGPGERRTRFAFFGQVNPFKGIDVLLEAVRQLSARERQAIVVEIHGANLDRQEEQFRGRVMELLTALEADAVVSSVGPYSREQLRGRMSTTDWVLVPSIWWENSPMVIQEAFAFGRPVICSNIGGMAEKVTDGVDGLHFDVGSARSLADVFRRILHDDSLWEMLYANLPRPLSCDACAKTHLALMQGGGIGTKT